MRLAIHLVNQQSVCFSDHTDLENVINTEKHSTLTGWFLANQRFSSARSISYIDFPGNFIWDKTKQEWKQRLKGFGSMIGRVYSAHPAEGERFYQRILLNHVTGCTSYQDIRTLPDGTICDTFKEAAFQRGLLEDDSEYDLILEEGAQRSMPAQFRQLFVIILLNNAPNNPRALWDKHLFLRILFFVLENLIMIFSSMSIFEIAPCWISKTAC